MCVCQPGQVPACGQRVCESVRVSVRARIAYICTSEASTLLNSQHHVVSSVPACQRASMKVSVYKSVRVSVLKMFSVISMSTIDLFKQLIGGYLNHSLECTFHSLRPSIRRPFHQQCRTQIRSVQCECMCTQLWWKCPCIPPLALPVVVIWLPLLVRVWTGAENLNLIPLDAGLDRVCWPRCTYLRNACPHSHTNTLTYTLATSWHSARLAHIHTH